MTAYTIGVITAAYAKAGAGDVVVQAFALTVAIFLGLTIFTMQSKIDFSFLGGEWDEETSSHPLSFGFMV